MSMTRCRKSSAREEWCIACEAGRIRPVDLDAIGRATLIIMDLGLPILIPSPNALYLGFVNAMKIIIKFARFNEISFD